jgi:hypothetical protein
MKRATRTLLSALLAVTATAQDRDPEPAWRDVSLVQQLRVVCEQKHFGRVQDLIAEIPGGRVTAAVVTMTADKGSKTAVVPFQALRYDAQANLLRLGTCLAEDEYPAFDPSQVKVGKGDDGGDGALVGTVLVSRLAGSAVALQDGSTASAQGLTLELASGHVAFVDIAAGRERAGDRELHPVPWSVVRLAADQSPGGGKAPLLALPMTRAALAAAPTLVDVIVPDPLWRARIYTAFGVRRQEFDRDS